MNKKIIGLLGVILLAVLAAIVWLAGPAGATPANKFQSYTETLTWYKSGGTLNDIWPQDLTAITCGGIKQTDTYHITSKKMDADYQALKNLGKLTGPQDDAEFTPTNYSVVQLPDCVNTVPVPAEPTVNPATCDTAGSLVIPANTDTVKWLVDGNQVNAGQGGTVTDVGDHTVSAHTTYGNQFPNGDHSVTWTETVHAAGDQLDCRTEVTPVNPSVTEAECNSDTGVDSEPVLALADTKGVTYHVSGDVKQGSTVTVTATADDGYKLSGEFSYTHTFDVVPCSVPSSTPPTSTPPSSTPPTSVTPVTPTPKTPTQKIGPPVHKVKLVAKPVQPNKLASTGVATSMMIAVGLVLLIIGFLCLGLARTKREQ